jgi:hypothetical protein
MGNKFPSLEEQPIRRGGEGWERSSQEGRGGC